MMDGKFLAGRAAIVTGGLTGQGLAIAREFAKRGANVAAGSLISGPEGTTGQPDRSSAQDVQRELEGFGGSVVATTLDVRCERSIQEFILQAEHLHGPPDILVNAAGIYSEHAVAGHPDDLWNDTLNVNLSGAFRMIRRVLPGMIERRFGRIINIGSTAATVGHFGNAAYCASKAGLLGLTRCVALEGAAHHVTCVMISPGWVDTDMLRRSAEQAAAAEGRGRSADEVVEEIVAGNPQRRLIQPDEIAALAAHLCRKESLGITNEELRITGGAAW